MKKAKAARFCVAAAAAVAVLGPAGIASAEKRSEDIVSVTVKAPGVVARAHNFPVTVQVAADPGALDIASQPLRLHVLMAPECGGSFEGTTGAKVIDRPLPAPSTGAAYSFKAKSRANLKTLGTETMCAFVTDADTRQYATSTGDTTVAATKGCTKGTKRLERLRKSFKKSRGDKRRHLAKKLKKARLAKKRACTPKSTAG